MSKKSNISSRSLHKKTLREKKNKALSVRLQSNIMKRKKSKKK